MIETSLKESAVEIATSKFKFQLRSLATLAMQAEQEALLASSTSLWEVLQKHRSDLALFSMPLLRPEPNVTTHNSQQAVTRIAFIFFKDVADESIVEKRFAMEARRYPAVGSGHARDFQIIHTWRVSRTER